MFRDQPRALFGIAARSGRRGLDDHLDVAGVGDGQHAEAQAAAEIAIARVALAALAARGQFCSEPDLVGGAGAIDRLQDQFQVEGQLSDSPITTTGGSSPLSATGSQPPTSPLTVKPSFSRKRLTGR